MVPMKFERQVTNTADGDGSPEVDLGSLQVPIYALVGIAVAVAVVIGLGVWLAIRIMRKRSRKRREERRDTLFLTVKGVIDESTLKRAPTRTNQLGFSRANLTSSVVLPDKAIIRPDASRDEIVSFYSEQGKLPRPFAPFSFALNASHSSSTPSSSTEMLDKRTSTLSFSASAARLPASPSHSRSSSVRDSIRESFFRGSGHLRTGSALSTGSHFSVFSTGSSTGGRNPESVSGVRQRQVRQIFTPILPDELTLILGENVSILRSFDDGWCIVARPKPFSDDGDTELGAAPAWCFVKPMKGLRSERPVRSSSLGVTVQVEPENRPRNDIISWSNF